MRNLFSLPTQEVYCPTCFDQFFADGAEHECPKCGFKFDLRDRNLLGVVVKEPRKKAHVRFIINDLKHMQKLVGGSIQAVYWSEIIGSNDTYFLVCDVDGKANPNQLPNIEIPGDVVAGTVYVVRVEDAEEVSITKQTVQSIIFSLDSRSYGK